MKVTLNGKSYDLIDSGVSESVDKLTLMVVRNGFSYEEVKDDAQNGNEKIWIKTDSGAFVKLYKGYTIFQSAVQRENFAISEEHYDESGNVVSEAKIRTVVIIKLKKDPSYSGDVPEPVEPEEPEESDSDLLQEYMAKVDYLLMIME